MKDKLIKVEAPILAQPTPAEILQAVVQRGVTADNVAAVKEVVGLMERMEERNAAKQFTEAFIRLQEKIPQIYAEKGVPDKHGNVKYRYAPFEEIDAQARPITLAHGFCYSFDTDTAEAGKITAVCRLRHTGGHVESTKYTVRIGQGPYGATETQADGAALSYAKRGALCCALNIVVTHEDTDVRNEGTAITQEQADGLERRVALLNQPHDKFLKWLGVAKYGDIPSAKYQMADDFLTKKENVKTT